jgi:hypothetical protein
VNAGCLKIVSHAWRVSISRSSVMKAINASHAA